MSRSRASTALFCACIGLACAAGAQAQDPASDRALAELIRALTPRDATKLPPRGLAEGGVAVDVSGHFQQLPLARREDTGEITVGCAGTLAEASRFFGRDLETGAPLPRAESSAGDDGLAARAARHGLSPWEYQFYAGLIERAAPRDATRPKAATITILNNDGPGEGFNSTAPALLPAPGNSGANLGQQRLRLFEEAARIWGDFLDSSVTIRVRANFDPLTPCSPGGGVLGFAGPLNLFRDFPNAPLASTWYVSPLANKLRGADLDAGSDDIATTFNSSVDTGCLGAGTRFYYGFDNATPSGTVNLLVVLLHELGHGLGFLSTVDNSNGNLPGGIPDVWARLMFDRTQNRYWSEMTPAQRLSSQVNANNVLWDGPSVRIGSGFLTAGREAATGRVELYTPATLEPGSSVSHWNTTATPNLLMEPAINLGLPLTLDLTRQLMRDIGWYRDSTNDLVRDAITNVSPASGSVTVGSSVSITWTNTGGFNRNVTIELSTNGGGSFGTVVANNVANTGSFAWTVPNLPTTQARLRVREHDFAEPAGISAANFTIAANTPPSFTPAAPVTLTRGSPAAGFTVGSVSDAQTPAGSLVVTRIPGGTATGIGVSGITNTAGSISAQLQASCEATGGTVRFQVSDGSLTGTGDLGINVNFNPAPTLSYAAQSVNAGSGLTVNPATGPADNGSVTGIVVQGTGTYAGGIGVDAATGVLTLSNAQPVGTHTITIRATDNCGANTDASFQLTVNAVNTPPQFTPVTGIERQQGSPPGATVVIGSVSDAQTPAGDLVVTQIGGGTATGISVTGLVNDAGTVRAQLSASCTATAGTVRFQVSDGALSSTADLGVGVLANTVPVLGSYPATTVPLGGTVHVTPSAAPADNGSIDSLTVAVAPSSYSGSASVAPATGVVTLASAAPSGAYTATVSATDNCGASASRSFAVSVSNDPVFADGFE